VVQHELGVDEIAAILQQPVDAVGRAALLVRSQRQDDVAVRTIALGAIAQQRRHHDGDAVLHVLRAAAVEVAVLLQEHERIDRPVLAQRFDDVEMTDQQHRTLATRALEARDEVLLAPAGTDHLHIFSREAAIAQPLRHGFSGRSRAQARLGGLDLDELLEQVARSWCGSCRSAAAAVDVIAESGNGRDPSNHCFSPSFSRSCGAVSSSVYTFEPTSNFARTIEPADDHRIEAASRTRRAATFRPSASSLASGIA
jgi:hypothetical protein